MPNDPSQTIYVWLDALANYLTVAGYPCELQQLKRWPIDCQVLGKDIIKFHAIYWPAFLMALSLPLPKRMICHSHWLIDSFKMSKSRGNVVDPIQENKLYTHEGLRYYLLRASTTHSDTDYSSTQAIRRINAELADTYGNLLNRCCARAINPAQTIPENLANVHNSDIGVFDELLANLRVLEAECAMHYERADYYKAIDKIMFVLRLNNGLFELLKPWKLIKLKDSDLASQEVYTNLLAVTFETLRVCSILLQPVVPKLSRSALDRLDVSGRMWKDAKVSFELSYNTAVSRPLPIHNLGPLFPKLKV